MDPVVALYDDLSTARTAVQKLLDDDFDREHISLIVTKPDDKEEVVVAEGPAADGNNPRDTAAVSSVAGGVLGGLAGLLFGIGTLSIPGVGAVVLAGPIYTTVMGSTLGGVGSGLVGAMTERSIPDKRARYYIEGVKRGGAFVAVEIGTDEQREQATKILDAHHPVDIEAAAEKWIADGWNADAAPPEQFRPDEQDETDEKKHQYPTGALGSDGRQTDAKRTAE